MADHAVSISNNFNFFGGGETARWGSFDWGDTNWGSGDQDIELSVGKLFGNDLGLSGVPIKNSEKSVGLTFVIGGDMASEMLSDGAGYKYVFVSETTEGEDRDFTSYTDVTGSTTSWSTAPGNTVTWSET